MDEKRDQDLLREHLEGRPGAFDALARRYADELFGFILRFVNDAAAADDLVQESLLQVHLSADAYDPRRSFKPWLYTIAANKARDYLRSRARRQMQSLDVRGSDGEGPSAAEGVAAEVPGADECIDADERQLLVRRLVAEMPDHLRTVLLLGYFQKLPYAEIAEILEIPVGTVKSRLHAAVNHFAGVWEKSQRESAASAADEVEKE